MNSSVTLVKFRGQPWQRKGTRFAVHCAKIFETRHLVSYFFCGDVAVALNIKSVADDVKGL